MTENFLFIFFKVTDEIELSFNVKCKNTTVDTSSSTCRRNYPKKKNNLSNQDTLNTKMGIVMCQRLNRILNL